MNSFSPASFSPICSLPYRLRIKQVYLNGIESNEAFGDIDFGITLIGIPSDESFGSCRLTNGTSLVGISSQEQFGRFRIDGTIVIKKGSARCLSGDNILKDAENKISEKEKIRQYFGDQTEADPVKSGFKYNHNVKWCDFSKGRTCPNGAILPKKYQR